MLSCRTKKLYNLHLILSYEIYFALCNISVFDVDFDSNGLNYFDVVHTVFQKITTHKHHQVLFYLDRVYTKMQD